MELDPNSFAAALAVARGTVGMADGVLAVPLRRGRAFRPTHEFALISKEDRDSVASYFWSKDGHGYVRRRVGSSGKTLKLHRVIMGLEDGDGLVVDHINGDPLDNRRENLRVCTQAENAQNRFATRGASKYRGVGLKADTPRARPWSGHVTLDGKTHFVGNFATEEEAGEATAQRRRELMPFTND